MFDYSMYICTYFLSFIWKACPLLEKRTDCHHPRPNCHNKMPNVREQLAYMRSVLQPVDTLFSAGPRNSICRESGPCVSVCCFFNLYHFVILAFNGGIYVTSTLSPRLAKPPEPVDRSVRSRSISSLGLELHLHSEADAKEHSIRQDIGLSFAIPLSF